MKFNRYRHQLHSEMCYKPVNIPNLRCIQIQEAAQKKNHSSVHIKLLCENRNIILAYKSLVLVTNHLVSCTEKVITIYLGIRLHWVKFKHFSRQQFQLKSLKTNEETSTHQHPSNTSIHTNTHQHKSSHINTHPHTSTPTQTNANEHTSTNQHSSTHE